MDIHHTRAHSNDLTAGTADRPEVAALTTAVALYHAAAMRAMTSRSAPYRNLREVSRTDQACDLGALEAHERLLSTGSVRVNPPDRASRDIPVGPAARESFGRLQALASRVVARPGARELAYGFPLVYGRLPAPRGPGRVICAPLIVQTVRVATRPDGSIHIEATDVPPLVNAALWADSLNQDQHTLLTERCRDAQADLARGFRIERVNTLLTAMCSVLPGMAPGSISQQLTPWPEGDPAEGHDLAIAPAAALFSVNRASPHLLDDLQRLADNPTAYLNRGGPLAVLMNPPSHEARPRLVTRTEDQVFFPFASNGPQRRVVDAVARNELVVVQGPPGTGKSQTIANLVAHLVARGQRVLVTSHKPQALVVVRDLLEQLEVRFLAGGLVGEEDEAAERLRTDIDRLKAFAARAEPGALDQELQRLEAARSATAAEYAAARDALLNVSLPDQARAVELWDAIGTTPTPPLDDPPLPADARPAMVAALREHDRLTRLHGPAFTLLAEWGAPDPDRLARTATLIAWAKDSRAAHLAALGRPRSAATLERWAADPTLSAASLSETARGLDRVERLIGPLLEGLRDHGDHGESIVAHARTLAADSGSRRAAREQLAELSTLLESARVDADHRNAVAAPIANRTEIASQRHEAESGGARRRRVGRRWLEQRAPDALHHSPHTVAAWARFWDTWDAITLAMAQNPSPLVADGLLATEPDLADLGAMVDRLEAAATLADTLTTARDLCQECPLETRCDRLIDGVDAAGFGESMADHRAALNALSQRISPPDMPTGSAEALLAERLRPAALGEAEAEPRLDQLEAALGPFSAWVRSDHTTTAAIPAAAEAVRRLALAGQPAPSWLTEGVGAFARHAAAHHLAELSGHPTPADLCDQIERLRSRLGDQARELLAIRVQHNLLHALHTPSFLTGLDTLRNQIGAEETGRAGETATIPTGTGEPLSPAAAAFPCWLARPEEACRLFPLDAAPVDVLIVDEASQCNPDVALPLFARARRVIVFGDDKQLSNEDLVLTLSAAQNAGLRTQMNLEHLDPEGRFDELSVSLLGMASQRQQAQVMLTEHFRCRPEIVAFSNRRFYSGALQVMRTHHDHRGLANPILVREITDADAPSRGRVNEVEAEALIADLQRRLRDPRYAGLSFGVLSLFREQVDHIDRRIAQEVPRDLVARHRLICATVDGFQGDERDVVYYSWRYTGDSSAQLFNFAQGPAGARRINVALTRARHQMVHFISAPPSAFPPSASNVSDFLRLAANPPAPPAAPPPPTAPPTVARLAGLLAEAGYQVHGGTRVAGVAIDLVVTAPDGDRRIAVLCDAEPRPTPSVDAPDPVEAHSLLTRSGWCVARAAATEVLTAPARAVGRVQAAVAAAPRRPPADHSEPSHLRLLHEAAIAAAAPRIDGPPPIAAEDRPSHPWLPPPPTARERRGERVFMSEFERELYAELADRPDLMAVPQWPSRGQTIDLVLTDRTGRRLALEADGDHFHTALAGLSPAGDHQRQTLLEEAGWAFHRVRLPDWRRDRQAEVDAILTRLSQTSPDADLARATWPDGVAASADARTEDREDPQGASAGDEGFWTVDLGRVTELAGALVHRKGSMSHLELERGVLSELGLSSVSDVHRPLLRSLIWAAAGGVDRAIDDRDGQWHRGTRPPAVEPTLNGWTLARLLERARACASQCADHDALVRALANEVTPNGAPRGRAVQRSIGLAAEAAWLERSAASPGRGG